MGQAKIKQRAAFAPTLIEEWEADDCVNFSVALARETGWLLHVDWWIPSLDGDDDIPLEQWKPLRVYVADNGSRVFDARGHQTIREFTVRTTQPMAILLGNGGIRTRFYDEASLGTLSLRSAPDPAKIQAAQVAIRANKAYLASIAKRPEGSIPAYDAAKYTFGRCAAFAEALREHTGLEPVALHAERMLPGWDNTSRGSDGYVHSMVLHPDGMAEDSWGKATVQEMAERFGVAQYRISRDTHARVLARLQRNSPENYAKFFIRAKELLRKHRA